QNTQPLNMSVKTMDKDLKLALLRWIDSEVGIESLEPGEFQKTVDWARIMPFVVLHLACLGVLWVVISLSTSAGENRLCASPSSAPAFPG
ncbi:MAG: hypothetical protein KFF68_05090, partial [Desulfosarcina sp.]|nr:hypothetical protein [Desulfosarcina sp.]